MGTTDTGDTAGEVTEVAAELRGIFRAAGYGSVGFSDYSAVPASFSAQELTDEALGPSYRYEGVPEYPRIGIKGHPVRHVHYVHGKTVYLSDLLGAPLDTAALANAIAVDADGTLCFRGTNGKRYYIDPRGVKDVIGNDQYTNLTYAIYGGALNEVTIPADVSYVYQRVAEARSRKNGDL